MPPAIKEGDLLEVRCNIRIASIESAVQSIPAGSILIVNRVPDLADILTHAHVFLINLETEESYWVTYDNLQFQIKKGVIVKLSEKEATKPRLVYHL